MKISLPLCFASAVCASYVHASSFSYKYHSHETSKHHSTGHHLHHLYHLHTQPLRNGSCKPSTVKIRTTATLTVYTSLSAPAVTSFSAVILPSKFAASSLSAVSTTADSIELKSTSALSPSSTSSPLPISAQYKADALKIISTLATTYNNKSKTWQQLWGYQAATIYQDLMDFDYWTGTTSEESYGNALLDLVNDKSLFSGAGCTVEYNDDREWWMLAFLHGYRKYGHVELLNKAVLMFKQVVASSQLSAHHSGTTPDLGGIVRSEEIPKTCDVAGSVYWKQSASSTINAVSTGLIGHIGALLYSITKEESYRTAADLAINYERRQFLSLAGIINVDSLTPKTCHKNGGDLCYNTGIYLAACTLLYQTTGEAKYLELATLTATTSIQGVFGNRKSAPLVIDQGSGGHDVFFRCLNEFYAMLKSKNINPDLQGGIKNFVKANVDSLLANAERNNAYTKVYLENSKENAWNLGSMLGAVMGAMIML